MSVREGIDYTLDPDGKMVLTPVYLRSRPCCEQGCRHCPYVSLQERYSPESICFGCGPKNDKGLGVRSFADYDPVAQARIWIAVFNPQKHHEAFPGMVNGGIIGALLDCHSNWSAAHELMITSGRKTPPCTVTAEFNVKLLRPTPSDQPIVIRAKVKERQKDRATILAELFSGKNAADLSQAEMTLKPTARCEGIFVEVKPGHPAFHRW